MKILMVLMTLAAAAASYGYEEFRTFTMHDGTTLRAVVIACDTLENRVELVTEGGNPIRSPKTVFIEEDQEFLTEWERCTLFKSPTDFVVIPTRWTHREWTGEAVEPGSTDGFTLASGETEYRYCLTLYNLGGIPLNNLSVDYHISYRRHTDSREPGFFAMQSEASEGRVSVTSAVDGAIPVETLGVGKWKSFMTDPVSLADINSALSSSEVEIVVHMQTADGRILDRYISLPDA